MPEREEEEDNDDDDIRGRGQKREQQRGGGKKNKNKNDPNLFRILIATDNHLGAHERDPIRKNDSFIAFREILETAKKEKWTRCFWEAICSTRTNRAEKPWYKRWMF
jgi:hypothetical protein